MSLYIRRLLCDWHDDDAEVRQLEAAITRGEKAALRFAVLAISNSPAVQRHAAEIYVRDKHPSHPNTEPFPDRLTRNKIRIGYFSADYYNHATSYLMAELFERHDRNKFEIIGFSLGPPSRDEMNKRVPSAKLSPAE